MKHLLLTTIAAVVLVGCAKPPPPDISIHDAAYEGNIEAVKQHITAGTDGNAKDGGGQTPLHRAALRDHKGTVELLIANSADRNAKDVNGRTPLHYATSGYSETVRLLLANGADVNAKDGGGETPLDLAIQQQNTEIVELLRKHGGKSGANDSIYIAASVGNIEAVKQHLATGADVNAKDKFGSTPMHTAARFGQKEVSELLIAKGADVNAKNNDGVTPLDTAIVGIAFISRGEVIMHKHPKTADLIREHGGKTGEELKAERK